MIKILVCGANGKMGVKVKQNAENFADVKCVCGVDLKENYTDADYPVYPSFDKVKENPDVVIDFSSRAALNSTLSYCVKNGVPAVLCATGFTEEDDFAVKKAAEKVALFRSANMSLGVNVLLQAVKLAAEKLCGFDVEIIEKHHNKKADAPSGTAVMLLNAIKEVYPDKTEVYGRQGLIGARKECEIGVHAVRGGTIVGEHQVIFAGNNETLTFTHQAESRDVFANGAINAAKFLIGKEKGLFDMKDLLNF